MSFKIHLVHYLVLFAVLVSGFLAFFKYQGHQVTQFYIVVATVLSYVLWGVVHHKLEKRLSIGVIMEYVLVGTLVILLFFLNLLR
jgi:hypothetical protein